MNKLAENFVSNKSDIKISIIIPAFNEEYRIKKTLNVWKNILNQFFPYNSEILVIMDGSTDKTRSIVNDLSENNKMLIPLYCERRLGKGGAIVRACKEAAGDILFFVDADSSLTPREFIFFIKSLKRYDLVIGSRYLNYVKSKNNIPLERKLLSRFFNALVKILFKEFRERKIQDTQCGLKAIKKNVIMVVQKNLITTDFVFDINLIYTAVRDGFKVKEVGIEYIHNEISSKVSSNLLKTSLIMLLSTLRLRIYYSRINKILSSSHLKPIIRFLMKWIY